MDVAARNEVVLVGRVAAGPEERTLPSGDILLIWRLVVDRPRPGRAAPEGVRVPTVDTLDCVAWATNGLFELEGEVALSGRWPGGGTGCRRTVLVGVGC